MRADIKMRWLGTAGLEFSVGDAVLAVDPFFTRPGLLEIIFGRPRSDEALAASRLPRCEHVLITHPHYDHLMDVPAAINTTGAQAYGSPNSCELMALLGVPEAKINLIKPGDHLTLGNIHVQVLLAEHRPLFGMRLATGPLNMSMKLPLRALDYRMDACFSFNLRVGERSILICSGLSGDPAPPADVLLVAPYGEEGEFKDLLEQVRPKLVIPNHWDDFMRPLSKPVRMLRDPSNWLWPPLRRVDLQAFARIVGDNAPRARLQIPQMFEQYDIETILQA